MATLLRLRILGENDIPISDAAVTVGTESGRSSAARFDREGHAFIIDFSLGYTLTISVQAQGYEPVVRTYSMDLLNTVDQMDLRLRKPGQLYTYKGGTAIPYTPNSGIICVFWAQGDDAMRAREDSLARELGLVEAPEITSRTVEEMLQSGEIPRMRPPIAERGVKLYRRKDGMAFPAFGCTELETLRRSRLALFSGPIVSAGVYNVDCYSNQLMVELASDAGEATIKSLEEKLHVSIEHPRGTSRLSLLTAPLSTGEGMTSIAEQLYASRAVIFVENVTFAYADLGAGQ